MPNTIERPDAQALPEATNRRAVLRGMLVAGSIGAIPVSARPATASEPVSGPTGLDAGLFALIEAARAANARHTAASDAAEELWEKTEKVPLPIVTEEDARLWNLKAGDRFDLAHLNLMRERQAHSRNLKDLMSRLSPAALAAFVATMDDKDRPVVEKMNARDAREDQLIAAHDEWKEARRVAKDRSGETAAEELAERLFNERYDACERVALYRARTLAGIVAKLAFIAGDFDAEEEIPAEMGTSERILFSVAVDFKELNAGEARA